ncbi:MAG: hypothetical protein N2712_07580 [Brevinematales bacterium]|nr:hypothetical protein [Brevinematales bacterium]
MYIPISLVWIEIILVLVSVLLGKHLSKSIEPVPIDNIIKESHNFLTPLILIFLLLFTNVTSLALLGHSYLPNYQITLSLISYLDNNLAQRIAYSIIHILSFTSLPIFARFISAAEYKYRLLLILLLLIISIGILHFIAFVSIFIFVLFTS